MIQVIRCDWERTESVTTKHSNQRSLITSVPRLLLLRRLHGAFGPSPIDTGGQTMVFCETPHLSWGLWMVDTDRIPEGPVGTLGEPKSWTESQNVDTAAEIWPGSCL